MSERRRCRLLYLTLLKKLDNNLGDDELNKYVELFNQTSKCDLISDLAHTRAAFNMHIEKRGARDAFNKSLFVHRIKLVNSLPIYYRAYYNMHKLLLNPLYNIYKSFNNF